MIMLRLTKQQRIDALNRASQQRREHEARGETDPLDEWPDGPPEWDPEAMKRFLVALRQWHELHVGPVTETEWLRARADHGLPG
jgi:hypothetical protein